MGVLMGTKQFLRCMAEIIFPNARYSRSVIKVPTIASTLCGINDHRVAIELSSEWRGISDGLASPAAIFGKPRTALEPPRGSIAGDWRSVGQDIRSAMNKVTANS